MANLFFVFYDSPCPFAVKAFESGVWEGTF